MIVGFMLLNVISEISKFNLLLTIYIIRQQASLMPRTQEPSQEPSLIYMIVTYNILVHLLMYWQHMVKCN